MSDIPFFCEQLRKGHSDDPWHGPAIADLLADVTAGEAVAHPVPGAHSVWEIVLHRRSREVYCVSQGGVLCPSLLLSWCKPKPGWRS